MYLTGKYVYSTGSWLRTSASPYEHGNGNSASIAAQETTKHLSNYTVTCGYCSTSPCLLLLHFTRLWALFPSAQSSLGLPFPVHPPTLRASTWHDRQWQTLCRSQCWHDGFLRFVVFRDHRTNLNWDMKGSWHQYSAVFQSVLQYRPFKKNVTFTAAFPKLFFYDILFVENKPWQIVRPIASWDTLRLLTLRRLMSYIYAAPILDVSRSHTTTQHSR